MITPEQNQALIDDIAQFYDDPLKFVIYTFPWKKAGTPLVDADGPDEWQKDIMRIIRDKVKDGLIKGVDDAIQIAVASGHGIGKTALVAWIILWFISTREFPQIVVTANTQIQLLGKTWRELSKWHRMSIHSHWFKWTATKFYHVAFPEVWFASAIPWSETKSDSFAGTHEKHVMIIFDEASSVADVIWEVAQGAMTTPGAIMLAFGNPTQNTGEFRQCFGKFRNRWETRQIDSRTAKMTNKKKIGQWIEDYGEDSDFVRVRVKGMFPRQSSTQFIPNDIVELAQSRTYPYSAYEMQPKVMAIDVARQGDDASVIAKRQGLHCSPLTEYHLDDLMDLVGIITKDIEEYEPNVVFLDANTMGWAVYDRLKQLKYNIVPINWSKPAIQTKKYYNGRAEMWGTMREWLRDGGSIPDSDNALFDDLIGPEFGYDAKNRVQLEKKETMKSRGLASPDKGDALAMTFARSVREGKRTNTARRRQNRSWRTQ